MGFEPTIRCRIHTFQACAFNHSATLPHVFVIPANAGIQRLSLQRKIVYFLDSRVRGNDNRVLPFFSAHASGSCKWKTQESVNSQAQGARTGDMIKRICCHRHCERSEAIQR